MRISIEQIFYDKKSDKVFFKVIRSIKREVLRRNNRLIPLDTARTVYETENLGGHTKSKAISYASFYFFQNEKSRLKM
jgi:hypothetical protein